MIQVRPFSVLAAAACLTACASARPVTAVPSPVAATTADPPAHAADEPAHPESRAPSAPSLRPDQLACRANADGNELELFLDWDGAVARGTLRESAPSGVVTERAIKAERYKDLIIVDDPEPVDLATHVAVVADRANAKQIQLSEHPHAWKCD